MNFPDTVALGNVAEYHKASERFGEKAAGQLLLNSAAISTLSLWCRARHSLTIMEEALPEPIIGHIRALFPSRKFEMVTISAPQEEISEAIIRDSQLFNRLAESFRRGASFEFWGFTPKVGSLLMRLNEVGALPKNVRLPSVGQRWRCSYLGSKSGFRDFSLQRELPLPDGWVLSSLELALDATANFSLGGERVVIKADRGVGGACQLFSPPPSPDNKIFKGRLDFLSRRVPELGGGTVIVEQEIEGGRSLSGQGFCDGSGYFSTHFTALHLHCQVPGGALIGKDVIDCEVEKKLLILLKKVGRAVSLFGYRGVLGVDFITDDKGELFLLEFNPRRTSLSHAMPLLEGLLGKGWRNSATILIAGPVGFSCTLSELLGGVEGSLFERGSGEGIVLTSFTKSGLVTFAIIGASRERCMELAGKLPIEERACHHTAFGMIDSKTHISY